MSIIKTDRVVTKDGQLTIFNLLFRKGKKLDIIIYEDEQNKNNRNGMKLI